MSLYYQIKSIKVNVKKKKLNDFLKKLNNKG